MAETPAANNMQAENVAISAAEMTPAAATATMPPPNPSLEALQRQMASAAQTAEKVFRSEFLANHFNDASQNALQFQQAADQAGNVTYSVTPSNPAMPMNEVAASINNVFTGMQDITGSFSVVPPSQGQTAFQVMFPAGVTADKLYEFIINAEISKQQALQMAATAPAEQSVSAAQNIAQEVAPAAIRPIGMNTATGAIPAMQAPAQQATAEAMNAPAMQQPVLQPVAGNMSAGKQWTEKVAADRAMAAENVASKA